MKNRALKISVSIPLKTVEELDKITTYKNRSRSKWITNAIQNKLKDIENIPERTERQLMAALRAKTEDPLLTAILNHYLGLN